LGTPGTSVPAVVPNEKVAAVMVVSADIESFVRVNVVEDIRNGL